VVADSPHFEVDLELELDPDLDPGRIKEILKMKKRFIGFF
jgi:hypothetical protein